MTLKIELSGELEQRVVEAAARRRQEPAEFARAVLDETLAPVTDAERRRRAIVLLDQWSADDATSGVAAGDAPVIPSLSLRESAVG
jgi:hypothetical protein